MKRLLQILLAAAMVAAALATALTLPASAELRSVTVRMSDGSLKAVVVDVPEGATLQDIRSLVPGEPVSWEPVEPTPPAPQPPTTQTEQPAPGAPAPDPAPEAPSGPTTAPQTPEGAPVGQLPDTGPKLAPKHGKKRRAKVKPKLQLKGEGKSKSRPKGKTRARPRHKTLPTPKLRNRDGSPAPSNPGLVDALPGPSYATGVPNFVIRKFRVPVFLLSIYQAAGIQYGVRWEVLAAINEIETDYGRNLNVSSAGALGWMQFIPSTWRMYGVDANKDGKKDPYNPVDAIFAAARYLKAAGAEKDVRRAVFAYNHANWYVDSVMLRAKLIAGVPADLVGSLTGLTEGRFPVAARARYADDLKEHQATKKVGVGKNAANIVESDESRRSVAIYAKRGAPVVATNDGQVKKIGATRKLGRYVILQDVYGNRYMYSGLGSVARYYPIAREDAAESKTSARALKANHKADRKPKGAATAGRQPEKAKAHGPARRSSDSPTESTRTPAIKQRLFAHPDMPDSREHGGYEQLLDIQTQSGGLGTYQGYARPVRIDPKRFTLRRLRPGAHVIAGTPLGSVGTPDEGKAPHLDFGIRPAGKGAPRIDPKPILDGWKLLEATSIYRASGKNALRDGEGGYSIGQILLMPKATLQKRVLADHRIEIYACGRENIAAGQVDRRVLATMEYLAESGLRPSISSLKCGHGLMTASGNVSEHSSGNAMDIASINGIPIVGHQEAGGITEVTVRRLMRLQGTLRPHQIISLLDLGQNTMALSDHYNHIHVGFQPRYGANAKLARQARAVLRPGQWPQLLKRLEEIENPVVPTKPSKYAIPVRKLKPVGRLGR